MFPGSRFHRGFTLVELLLVITIIAVLAALLLPTLGRVRYRAKLAVCASNLHQIGIGVLTYCSDYRGEFPLRNTAAGAKVTHLKWGGWDMRPIIKDYIKLNELNCPFAPRKLDFADSAAATVEWGYGMWWGWQYVGEQGMVSTAKPYFTLTGRKYRILAADYQFDHPLAIHEGGHQCLGTKEANYDNGTYCISRWQAYNGGRGPVDLNFLFSDGSVKSYKQIQDMVAGRSDLTAISGWRDPSINEWRTPMPPSDQ